MKIYNTLTRQKDEFVPITPGVAKIYACGPTVYNFIHIGNARPACVFDTLRRYLEYRGYKVDFVQNFTDVDDKIIKKANEEGVTSLEISERYIKEYKTDAEGLNIRPATVHPKVTENMDNIIGIVNALVEKGFAYESKGDVYFRTGKFNEYGKLSHMPLEDLEAGARIDVDETKEAPSDFALWKAAKPGEPHWTSPWSEGRPGWHIECSAMAKTYLADTIDIHCGGQDLIFPHHENEIAQSECANGVPFANYWMHNGYINVDNRKMSKSLNNFFTVRDVAREYGYEPIRYLMIQSHYRSPINYSVEVMNHCKAGLERLYNCKEAVEAALKNAGSVPFEGSFESYKDRFVEAMDDDLNTADALSVMFELARELNTAVKEVPASKEKLEAGYKLYMEMANVLGILYTEKKEEEIPAEVLALLEERAAARKNKDFALADQLRDKIGELGYLVEETRQGTKLTKKN